MHFPNNNFKYKMKRLQIAQKRVYEQSYVHETAAVNLSKIYLPKNAKTIAIELNSFTWK